MATIASFHRMTPFETAVGWIFGLKPEEDSSSPNNVPDGRHALEMVILDALRSKGPTFVTFSGGRDSTAILALAVSLAHSEGLDPPVPVTNRYPGVDSTDEDDWQELVIRHLGVLEWLKLSFGEEEDLLGEPAIRSLRRFGLLWPPTLHLKGRLLEVARGGTVLTGEGGDSILGPRRISPISGLIRRRVHPRRRAMRMAVENLAPRPIRRRVLSLRLGAEFDRPWLTVPTRELLGQLQLEEALAEPLHWSRSVRILPRVRAVAIGLMNQDHLGQLHEVRFVHPFHDARFVHSWATQGGVLGFPGRIAAMEALFRDLLPPKVLTRTTKATFAAAFVRGPSREFVRNWEGDGVDPSLVIPECLKQELLRPEPHAGTLPLLHAAWYESSHSDVNGSELEA